MVICNFFLYFKGISSVKHRTSWPEGKSPSCCTLVSWLWRRVRLEVPTLLLLESSPLSPRLPSYSRSGESPRHSLHPYPNICPEGEWIFQSSAHGFSNVPILYLLLWLTKACWVCFEDKGKNNITLFSTTASISNMTQGNKNTIVPKPQTPLLVKIQLPSECGMESGSQSPSTTHFVFPWVTVNIVLSSTVICVCHSLCS